MQEENYVLVLFASLRTGILLLFQVVIVGGSYGLQHFATVRYEFRKGKMVRFIAPPPTHPMIRSSFDSK